VSPLHAKAAVRFSLGRHTTAHDIDRAVDAARAAIGPLLQAEVAAPDAFTAAASAGACTGVAMAGTSPAAASSRRAHAQPA
jgi:hypothetical protein